MKIGIITNLVDIDNFRRYRLSSASSQDWMLATGGNTGNVAFVQGVDSIINAEHVAYVHWGDDPKHINEYYDRLIICCANQVGSHVNLINWYEKLAKIDLPVTFVGLGAQSEHIGKYPEIPEGTIKLLNLSKSLRFDTNKTNIVTRGEFTSEVLGSIGIESSPLGCPSQFISTEPRIGDKCLNHQRAAKELRVLTAAGNPYHVSKVLEQKLVEIVSKYKGDYVLQHPASMVQLAVGEHEYLNNAQRKLLSEAYSFLGNWDDICSWFRSYGVLFADVQNWMMYSKRFSVALGPRYHGIALPVQAGVPGKVIAIDSRTEELAHTTGIPFLRYEDVVGLSCDELVDWCRWDSSIADNYDSTRIKNAGKYVEFLESNGISGSLGLRELSVG